MSRITFVIAASLPAFAATGGVTAASTTTTAPASMPISIASTRPATRPAASVADAQALADKALRLEEWACWRDATAAWESVLITPNITSNLRDAAKTGRAVGYLQMGQVRLAIDELRDAETSTTMPPDVRLRTQLQLANAYTRLGSPGMALQILDKELKDQRLTQDDRASLMCARSRAYARSFQPDRAEIECTKATQLRTISARHMAIALLDRAQARMQMDRVAGAYDDCTAVIRMSGLPQGIRSMAHVYRASVNSKQNFRQAEVADYEAVIAMGDEARSDYLAWAYVGHGLLVATQNTTVKKKEAVADFGAALANPDCPTDARGKALLGRARANMEMMQFQIAKDDLDTLIAMPDAPLVEKAWALIERSRTLHTMGNIEAAIQDCRQAITMRDVPFAISDSAGRLLKVLQLADMEQKNNRDR